MGANSSRASSPFSLTLFVAGQFVSICLSLFLHTHTCIKCLYICGLCCVKSIVKTRKKPLLFLLLLLLLFFIEFYKKIFLLWSHFRSLLLLLLLPWLVFIVMLCDLPLLPPFVHCWWISAHAACHVNEKKQKVEEEARDKERRVKKHQLTFWLMCVLLLLPLTFLLNLNTNKHTHTHADIITPQSMQQLCGSNNNNLRNLQFLAFSSPLS